MINKTKKTEYQETTLVIKYERGVMSLYDYRGMSLPNDCPALQAKKDQLPKGPKCNF